MNDAGHPAWESDFLTSTLGSCEYSGVDYCIPFAGTQPVFFWYSKPLLSKYHLSWPKTLTALLADVKTLAAHNVSTLVLGNNGEWEGLMYLEYFTDRYGGPQPLLNVQENKPNAWSNPAFTKALEDIQLLVKDNAFEQGYSTINWGTGFTDALIYKNVALAELMGSWQIGFFTSVAPGWVKSGQLGIGAFPTVSGGKGNPTDLEGNTTTYVGLASHITAAQTYVAEQFAKYAWDSPRTDGADRPRYRAFAQGLADGVQLSAIFEAVPGHDRQRCLEGGVLPVLLGPGSWRDQGSTDARQPRQGVRAPRDAEAVRIPHEQAPVRSPIQATGECRGRARPRPTRGGGPGPS